MKKRQATAMAMSALMAAGLLSGTVVKAEEAPQKVSILCHSSWRNDGNQAAFDYVQEKLNVEFEFEEVPEGDAGEQLIFAKISSGEVPDILWWQPACTVNIKMGADQFEDLSDIRDWAADYDETSLQTKVYTIDGRQIVAPFGDVNIFGICYNKDVFEEYGVEVPKTWEELLEACKVFKENDITPVYLAGKDAWTLQIIGLDACGKEYALDSNLIEEMDTHQKTFADLTIMQGALENMQGLLEAGYVQDTYLSDTYVDAQEALLDGTCAMFPMASYIQPELAKSVEDESELESIGIFPIPYGEEQICTMGTPSGFLVPVAGENKDLAKQAIAELCSVEAAEAMYSIQNGIPFIKGVEGNAISIMRDASEIINDDSIMKVVDPATLTKYQKGTFEMYIQDMLVGNRGVSDVLAALDEDFAKQAEDAGDENWQ